MPKLSELDFTDLYVRIDSEGRSPSRYAPVQKRNAAPMPGNMEVPDEFEYEINLLRSQLERAESDDFSLDTEGMRLRASRATMFGDQVWVAMRRLPLYPPEIEELGFRPEVLAEMRSWGARTGLIVIGGSTRAGKTTTAVGLLTDYLKTFQKTAYTVEEPVEFFLMGEHGDGGNFVFQREVHRDEEWGEAVKTALRWAPRYIFLGEVRTAGAAKWLLRAATSGHCAICTVHGGSLEETLAAVLQLAEAELGATARSLLADGICAVMHQSLVQGRVQVQLLTAEANNQADPVRTAIRQNKLEQLGTQIEAQKAKRTLEAAASEDGESGRGSGGAGAGTPQRRGTDRGAAPGQIARPAPINPPARTGTPPGPPRAAGTPPKPGAPPPAQKKWGLF